MLIWNKLTLINFASISTREKKTNTNSIVYPQAKFIASQSYHNLFLFVISPDNSKGLRTHSFNRSKQKKVSISTQKKINIFLTNICKRFKLLRCGQSWRRATKCANILVVGSIPTRGDEMFIYIYIFISSLWCRGETAALNYATPHAMLPEIGGKWGTECLTYLH